jgi:hypothetical protein
MTGGCLLVLFRLRCFAGALLLATCSSGELLAEGAGRGRLESWAGGELGVVARY